MTMIYEGKNPKKGYENFTNFLFDFQTLYSFNDDKNGKISVTIVAREEIAEQAEGDLIQRASDCGLEYQGEYEGTHSFKY